MSRAPPHSSEGAPPPSPRQRSGNGGRWGDSPRSGRRADSAARAAPGGERRGVVPVPRVPAGGRCVARGGGAGMRLRPVVRARRPAGRAEPPQVRSSGLQSCSSLAVRSPRLASFRPCRGPSSGCPLGRSVLPAPLRAWGGGACVQSTAGMRLANEWNRSEAFPPTPASCCPCPASAACS